MKTEIKTVLKFIAFIIYTIMLFFIQDIYVLIGIFILQLIFMLLCHLYC